MLIRNNKTRQEQEITPEAWAQMKDKGLSNRFSVVNESSRPAKKIVPPDEVVQLRAKQSDKNKGKNKTAE